MSTTTAPELQWFGPFAALHALDLPKTTATDLYAGFYAGFYDDFTRQEQWDVPRYVTEAEAHGGRVLELACGSGRLALPLARAGVEVHGLDLSADMLKVLARAASAEPEEVRARISARVADMTDFDLGETFGLIVLGATSVCLLHTSEQRVAMLRTVARHLAPDGRLLFDFTHAPEDVLRAQDGEIAVIPATGGKLKRFTMLGRQWVPEQDVQLVNFYSEVVDPEGETRRFMGSTAKGVMREEELVAEVAEAGLEVLGVEVVLPAEGSAGDEIRLITAAHPSGATA